jgi:uncharacterized membrane protein YtjA (UPF0391 family)
VLLLSGLGSKDPEKLPEKQGPVVQWRLRSGVSLAFPTGSTVLWVREPRTTLQSLLDTTPPSGCRSSGTDRHLLLLKQEKTYKPYTVKAFREYLLVGMSDRADAAYNEQDQIHLGGQAMLYWSLMFLVVALIAGVLGFTGVAVAAAGIAKVLFVVFLVLFLVSLVAHLGAGRKSLN